MEETGSIMHLLHILNVTRQRQWCIDEDALKPGRKMYVGGDGRQYSLLGETVGSCMLCPKKS